MVRKTNESRVRLVLRVVSLRTANAPASANSSATAYQVVGFGRGTQTLKGGADRPCRRCTGMNTVAVWLLT
jgi:hypothetical protein